jgi:hypothetical protein
MFVLMPSEPRILRPGRTWRTLMPIYELDVPALAAPFPTQKDRLQYLIDRRFRRKK